MSASYQSPAPTSRAHSQTTRKQQVIEIQRARILAAAASAAEELGYECMTVAEIIRRAGLSRKTFYDTFSNRENCFLALLEQALGHASDSAGAAYLDQRDWKAGIRAALFTLLVLMEREPGLARLWIVESLRSGEKVLERRARVIDDLARTIAAGASRDGAPREPPYPYIEGVIGGIVTILHTRLVTSPGEPVTDLLGPLMYMIMLPYHGQRVARKELTSPPPKLAAAPTPKRRSGDDPLHGLGLRLTYRTVRVLIAIERHPGASNREVAEASGIVDQGQISKLLARLARLELVENRGEGHARGTTNAWSLTERGAAVVRAARTGAYELP